MPHVSGGDFRIGPAAPEQVRTGGSPDGAAGVLADGETIERLPGEDFTGCIDQRLFGFQVYQRGKRKQTAVQGNGTTGREFDVQAAQGAVFLQFEKHVAGIVVQHPPHFPRIRLQVGPDFLHRHFFQGDTALVDQQLSDAAVRLPVGGVIVHVQNAAVLQEHSAGALDLQEEQVHLAFQPGQNRSEPLEGVGFFDFTTLVKRHHRTFLGQTTGEDLGGIVLRKGLQIDFDQIVRTTQHRHGKAIVRFAAASKQRFVITGVKNPALRPAAAGLINAIMVADKALHRRRSGPGAGEFPEHFQ